MMSSTASIIVEMGRPHRLDMRAWAYEQWVAVAGFHRSLVYSSETKWASPPACPFITSLRSGERRPSVSSIMMGAYLSITIGAYLASGSLRYGQLFGGASGLYSGLPFEPGANTRAASFM